MKNFILLITLTCFVTHITELKAQTIWTGPTMTFTKADNVDWTLAENQDRITDNVWITRANTQGIFNIVLENSYTQEFSPADTRWAFGTTANYLTLEYDTWEEAIGTPIDMMNLDMVVHLITDDIYIDIKFTDWTTGGNGGGFTYERSTNPVLGVNDFDLSEELNVYPNPATETIKVANLKSPESYQIYNVLGCKVLEGTVDENAEIKVQNLKSGLYILHFKNGKNRKFIKR